MNIQTKIKQIYLDPLSGSYLTGGLRLFRAVKAKYPDASERDIHKFLSGSHVYSRVKKPARRRTYRMNVATSKNQAWYCDLMFSKKKPYLVCSDALIGGLRAQKIANKRPNTVLKAFNSFVLDNDSKPPSLVITDRGTEFSKTFTSAIKSLHGSRHTRSESFNKASQIESQIAKLRAIHRKHALSSGDPNFNKNLPLLVSILNHMPNSRTNISPADFKQSDSGIIFTKKYSRYLDARHQPSNAVERENKSSFHVGDHVRLQFARTANSLGKALNTTAEVFIITRADFDYSPPAFQVKDDADKLIPKLLYSYNLVHAEPNYKSHDRVSRVLSSKTTRGKKLINIETESGRSRTVTPEELLRLQKSVYH